MSKLSNYVLLAIGTIPEAPDDGQSYARRGSDTSWQVTLTLSESDSKYALVNHLHTGVYSPVDHLHTGVYQPVGNYLTDAPSDGSQYARQDGAWTVVIAAGGTDLSYTRGSTTVTVISSTGSNTALPAATTSLAGVMTAQDKTDLNAAGIAPGTSNGNMLRWNGSAWVETSDIRRVTSGRVSLTGGATGSTFPVAIGDNTYVEGSIQAEVDIYAERHLIAGADCTVTGVM